MKSKLFTLLLAVAASVGTMFASDTQVNGIWYDFNSSTKTAAVTYRGSKHSDYENEYQGDVVIPSSVVYNGATYRINKIADLAFAGCQRLTSIIIPSSITSIGSNAFTDCIDLISVEIPNTVTNVGEYAFRECNITHFNYKGDLIDWLNKTWSYEWNRYNTKYQLLLNGILQKDVIIPDEVSCIPSNNFWGCTSLTSISIPYNASVHSGAFRGCDNLTSISIGNNTEIAEGTFDDENHISIVNFKGDIEDWLEKSWIFVSPNYKLLFNGVLQEYIVIPNSITSFGVWTFYGCSSIKSITIPSSVTEIMINSPINLEWCLPNLESIVVTSDNQKYSSIDGVLFDKNKTTLISCPKGKKGMYTIPESTAIIESNAFYGCGSLTSINIPESITNIGYHAFFNVPNIMYTGNAAGAPWGARNINRYVEGNLVYNDETKDTLLVCSNAIVGELEIPNSVINIANKAFYSCTGLTSVTIPNSVTTIGNDAFRGCTSLNAITIPQSVSSIGNWTFYGCSQLESVVISSNVTNIGSYDFYNCSNLRSIAIPNSVTSIGYEAFSGCGSLASVVLPNSVIDIGGGAFRDCTSLNSATIPNGVISINENTFSNCSNLSSLSIPNTITSIGERAFYRCASLTSIVIPSSVTNIASTAFSGCRTRSIVWEAKDCNSYNFGPQVESFLLGKEVESIPNSLCSGMSQLTSMVIPNSVKTIGNDAFKGCGNLQTLTLGENITTYGSSAFSGCSALTAIYNYRKTPVALSADVFENVDYFACTLYVLEGSVDMYKSDRSSWKDFFYNIEPVSATSTTSGDDIQITPTDNTANIVWPQVDGAETYELVIKDKSGNVICTLIFNANGQLTQIVFHAPSHHNAPQQTQQAGFSFTVTGLESGTSYDLTMTSKDSSGGTLDTKIVSFTTTGETQGIEEISSSLQGGDRGRLILRDGQIYILRGEKVYTLTGAEVK